MFRPFEKISRQTFLIMVVSQVLFTLVIWQLSPGGLIPQPTHVLSALGQLLTTRLLIDNLLVSLVLTLQAMFYSIVITLIFSYLSVIPFLSFYRAVHREMPVSDPDGPDLYLHATDKGRESVKAIAAGIWYRAFLYDFLPFGDTSYTRAGVRAVSDSGLQSLGESV